MILGPWMALWLELVMMNIRGDVTEINTLTLLIFETLIICQQGQPNMKLLSCRHKHLETFRAHKQSQFGINYKDKAIIVDKADCLVFVRCQKCKQIMPVERDLTFLSWD